MKKINRNKFLKKSLPALGLGVLGSSCTSSPKESSSKAPNILSGKTYNWKMVTTWPPNFPVLGEGCNLFAQWVEEMSGGRMHIEVFGGGELVPSLEVFEAVSIGGAEVGHGAGYYWSGKLPAAQFFATVPFGMNAQQMNAWIHNGGGLALWQELYKPFNLLSFPGGNTGVQMGGWFNKEINSLTDIQGLKMRIPGLGGKVFSRAGGSAISVAGGEIYTNLERGVIDATEWIGPYHDYLMGFHKIAKYYYYPGWHEPGTVLETMFNKPKFDALPSDLRAILISAASRQNQWILNEFEAKNNAYLQKIREESDVEIRPFPPEVLTRLKELTQEILDEVVASSPEAKRAYDSYLAYRNSATSWAGLTERIFYNSLQG